MAFPSEPKPVAKDCLSSAETAWDPTAPTNGRPVTDSKPGVPGRSYKYVGSEGAEHLDHDGVRVK